MQLWASSLRSPRLIKTAQRSSWACCRRYSKTATDPVVPARLHDDPPFDVDASGITIGSTKYSRDHMTNVSPSILKRLDRRLPSYPRHPLGQLTSAIQGYLPGYEPVVPPSPVITPVQNFDNLGFPPDHSGRSLTDSYYLNKDYMLRTHTSAHEVDIFATGKSKWLLASDVFRRDEIDASHFPVFHQMEGAHVLPRSQVRDLLPLCEALEASLEASNIVVTDPTKITSSNPYQTCYDPDEASLVTRHLKATLNSVIYKLFRQIPGSKESQEPLHVRWIEAYFPFTSPSYEVEVLYMEEWLEVLGCGVVKQATLDKARVPEKMGWAFGLGLERLAMICFNIPDIRLFWSTDARFWNQFQPGQMSTFKPFSKNPPCYKDVSFWLPTTNIGANGFHENDFCEIIRDAGGLLVEEVKLIDQFTHPKTQRQSRCYRINYRSMDGNLENEAINALQGQVLKDLVTKLNIEIR